MDGLNLSWRGQPRSGKRKALHSALQKIADIRGIPFHIQTRQFHMQGAGKSDTGQISTTADDDGAEGGSEKDCFPYEFSLLHIGFDIARMSMQDKIYLKPILQRWSVGSQVLAGNQGRACRILVFYHAHLFSTESYFLLHSLLENNYGDVSLWFTSELPVADRLSDYFVEIPVANQTPFAQLPTPSWYAIFVRLLTNWSKRPFPLLAETNEIRAFLYELLMRNLRWTDCVHHLLDVMLTLPLESEKRNTLLAILAKQEATAAGETIPSYRIPLLWENLFLDIREAISSDRTDGESSTCLEDTRGGSQASLPTSTSTVVVGQRDTKRHGGAKAGSARAKPVRSAKAT
jgi:hypothetical protein